MQKQEKIEERLLNLKTSNMLPSCNKGVIFHNFKCEFNESFATREKLRKLHIIENN